MQHTATGAPSPPAIGGRGSGAAIASGFRYPVELIDVIKLKGGERVIVRPILPQDEGVAKAFFQSLSPRSRSSRFMQAFQEIPDRLLAQLTHVDHCGHLVLVAEVFTDAREIVIGEARYVVGADGRSAEFAISIADEWQGLGLGTSLLSRLIEAARRAGLQRITGETLASNFSMLRLAEKAGFSCAVDEEITELVQLSLRFAASRMPGRMN
jgi:acetyltransferase